jgi:hypothetical protein
MRAEDKEAIANAFPPGLGEDVRQLIGRWPNEMVKYASHAVTEDLVQGRRITPLLVEDQEIRIPYRIYLEDLGIFGDVWANDRQALIYHCLFTRHCDGFVRQRHLKHIIESSEPWTVPYVVSLLGEYVVEVVVDVCNALPEAHTARGNAYADFVNKNADFLDLVQQRVRSYWACYCNDSYPDIETYPGQQAMSALRTLASSAPTDSKSDTT